MIAPGSLGTPVPAKAVVMSSQQDRPWALVPTDVAEWMGMWEAVPAPPTTPTPTPMRASPAAPVAAEVTVPTPRSWRDRIHVPGLHLSAPRPK
jgi:hypothetical protein